MPRRGSRLALRDRRLEGAKLRRQRPVGPYVVDFVCLRRGLVVEVDGGQRRVDDPREAQRTRFIEAQGFRVLRLWNNEVLQNPEGVLEVVSEALKGSESRQETNEPTPPHPPRR